MARYDALRMEIQTWGDPPPAYQPTVTYEDLQKAMRPSGMTKPLAALTARISRLAAGAKRQLTEMNRQPERDVHWHRAEFTRLDQKATMLAKSGDLTVAQGSILDQKLDLYFRRHCL